MTVLGAWVEGRDSLYGESLARDLGQILADDTALLVYDLRSKHKRRLDSVQAAKGLDQSPDLLAALSGGQVKWGLAVECRTEKREDDRGDCICLPSVLSMQDAKRILLDTLRFLPEAVEKRKKLGQSLARSFAAHFRPRMPPAQAAGGLRLNPPANPALLVSDMQIIRRGSIDEVPLGTTLVLGDVPGLIALSSENVLFVLYPNSSYTFLLPRLVQVHAGSLGLLRGADSGSSASRPKSAGTPDSSDLAWRDPAGQHALDSAGYLRQKLGENASAAGDSVLRKLGLPAFRESTAVITSSFVARGLPQAALVRQADGVSSLEVVRGSMTAHPLLGSQPPERVGAMRMTRTRGFALKQEAMSAVRGDRILREFHAVDPARGGRGLADFLPGRLFAAGASLRTPDRPMQAFISGEFRELDMEVDLLATEREGEGWSEPGTFRPGAHESGCYLCSPGRLGP